MSEGQAQDQAVGPVLQAGPLAAAVIAAIRDENGAVEVIDRGSYLRVLVPGRCRVSRAAIERHVARPVRLPADLELIMASFRGRFAVDEEGAEWIAGRPGQ